MADPQGVQPKLFGHTAIYVKEQSEVERKKML